MVGNGLDDSGGATGAKRFRGTSYMTERTTQSTVRFSSDVNLPGWDEPLPAGEYRVDHDEESIDDLSRMAWRRTGTFIHLPAIGSRSLTRQMLPITQADLDAALEKDMK